MKTFLIFSFVILAGFCHSQENYKVIKVFGSIIKTTGNIKNHELYNLFSKNIEETIQRKMKNQQIVLKN